MMIPVVDSDEAHEYAEEMSVQLEQADGHEFPSTLILFLPKQLRRYILRQSPFL